jgi:periplasmic protein TonB
MRGHSYSPVADEEEPYATSHLADSSPSRSDSSPKPPKVSVDFDELVLDKGQMKRPRKLLQVALSFVGHSLFLVLILLIPLLYTHSINLGEFQRTFLVAPPAPPPPPAPHIVSRQPVFHMREAKLYAPRVIPKQIAIIKDQAQQSQPTSPGIFGGVPGGVPGGQVGGVLGGILGGNQQVAAPPPPPPQHGPYRVGGKIQAPRLIKEVKPIYPVLAKETRITGKVAIDCVIDQHGDITEARVVSGHPLLVSAALQAVEQWKYQPTLLNGRPIAVDMVVTVDFNLGGAQG